MADLVPVDHDPFADNLSGVIPPPDPSFGVRSNPVARGAANTIMGLLSGVATLPQRAFAASEGERLGLGYDPGPALEAATLPMAGGLAAPVRMGAGEAALGAGPIRAYHGSPYDFDKFDMSRIGTGEGAQAYGHGLYFAENPEVAKQYRDLLSTRGGAMDDPASRAQFWSSDLGGRDAAISHLEGVLKQASQYPKNFRADDLEITKQAIDYLKSGGDLTPKGGHSYEVSINADPEHFLDWDKPLSEQHPKVQEALEPFRKEVADDWRMMNPTLGGPTHTGQVVAAARDPAAMSQSLRSAGIPGIKYLDQGSRGTGEGTRNYVVFDDKMVDILRKYGMAGLIGGGAAHFKTTPVDHDPFAEDSNAGPQ